MESRLIFLDIDGTFLEPGRTEAPPSAVKALRAARAKGHKVFLCTGRNYKMTAPVLRYGFDGYVCSAGGYVVCGQTVLFDCPMDRAQSDGVRALLEAHGVDCTLEAKDATYGGAKMLERFAGYQAMQQAAPLNSELERWRRAFEEGMQLQPLEAYRGEPIYKICYIATDAASLLPAKQAYGAQFNFCETENFKPDGPGCINGELINRKFNKGEGIRRICAHLGLSTAAAVAFGDSENDLEMADVAAVSYCMANGAPALKTRCTHVCPAVGEDGIAIAFKELGLI